MCSGTTPRPSPIGDSTALTQHSAKKSTPSADRSHDPVAVSRASKQARDISGPGLSAGSSKAWAAQDPAHLDIDVEYAHRSRKKDPARGPFQSPLQPQSPSPPRRTSSSADQTSKHKKGPSHRQLAERNGGSRISPHQMLNGELQDITMCEARSPEDREEEGQPNEDLANSELARSSSPIAPSVKMCLTPGHAECLKTNEGGIADQLSDCTNRQWTLRGKVLCLSGQTPNLDATLEWLEKTFHQQDLRGMEPALSQARAGPQSTRPRQDSEVPMHLTPSIRDRLPTAPGRGTAPPTWRQDPEGSGTTTTMAPWLQEAARMQEEGKVAERFEAARSQEVPLRSQSGLLVPHPEQTPSIACAPMATTPTEPPSDGKMPMWRPMAWEARVSCHRCGLLAVCSQGPPSDVRDAQGRWACSNCLDLRTPALGSERSPETGMAVLENYAASRQALEHRAEEEPQYLQSLSDTLRSSDVSEQQQFELRHVVHGLRQRRDSSCAWFDNLSPGAMLNLMKRVEGMCLQGSSAKGMMVKLRQE